MPELPEVQTIVSELNQKLRGLKIISVHVSTPSMVNVGPQTVSNIRKVSLSAVAQFANFLKGQKIVSVSRRAKLLIFNLSGPFSLMVHLKMTGQFIFEDEKLKKMTGSKYRILNKKTAPLVKMPGKHTHVVFNFSGNNTLYYNDVRKFGYLKIVRDDQIGQIKELNDYGPEPLDEKYTLKIFLASVKNRGKNKVKQFLMDNKVVVGIGNIYSDEILFHAKVKPTREIASLSPKELKNVFSWIKPVLKQGIKAKGSSVGDFIRTNGQSGNMGKFHFVYGRKNEPCKKCGTLIDSVKLGGRTGSFCPKCQK